MPSDWNPNSPTIRGMETRFKSRRWIPMTSPNKAASQRWRPSTTAGTGTGLAANDLDAIHHYMGDIDRSPGLGIEVVDTTHVPVNVTRIYPGTDPGSNVSGFQDNGGGGVNFGDINDPFTDTPYARNTNNVSSNNTVSLTFRGNNSGLFVGQRILSVRIGAVVMNRKQDDNANNIRVQPVITLSPGGVATTYTGSIVQIKKSDSFRSFNTISEWPFDPSTQLPWVSSVTGSATWPASLNNMLNPAAAYTWRFGLRVYGKLQSQGFRIRSFWMDVVHCTENRRAFSYRRGTPRDGWDRYPLNNPTVDPVVAGSASMAANTWYEVVSSAITGSSSDVLLLDSAQSVLTLDKLAQLPTDNTREHRLVHEYQLTGPAGVGLDPDGIKTTAEQISMLFEVNGVIVPQSTPMGNRTQPATNYIFIHSGTTANTGQRLQTAGTVPAGGYVGVAIPVGWQDPTRRPDQVMTVEVRHGAGSISGGGTLDALGTLDPASMSNGDVKDYLITWPTFVALATTDYHIIFRSGATSGRGYSLYRNDTRSDNRVTGTGTSVAQVEGASQNGTTDAFIQNGTALTRYDLPLALFAGPNPPATVVATPLPAEPVNATATTPSTLPPRVRITWPATSHGSNFRAYVVRRRKRLTPIAPWEIVAIYDVPVGYTTANVEAHHREFIDEEAGWGVVAGDYVDGWDYAVSVLTWFGDVESAITTVDLDNDVVSTYDSWLTCNAAPFLHSPLRAEEGATSSPILTPRVYEQIAGRDHSLVRVPGTVPGRRYRIRWGALGYVDENMLRAPRALATSGRQAALLRCRGDRALGVLSEPSTDQPQGSLLADSDFYVTGDESSIANFNAPAGIILNGTTQYVTTPSTAALNPGSSAFTIIMAAQFADTAGAHFLTKGNIGASDGYAFLRTAGGLQFFVDGATTQGGPIETSTSWFDDVRVAIGTTNGVTQKLYRDGVVRATAAIAHGAVTNAVALVAGANNGGASGRAALAPLQSYAVYLRELTEAEAFAASMYLKGHHGFRLPAGAAFFVDLRDRRTWDGIQQTRLLDLSQSGLQADLIATPATRGIPWALEELERRK